MNIKKITLTVLGLVLIPSIAYSYGGGGGGALVFSTDTVVEGKESFQVSTFNLKGTKQNIFINCAEKEITYFENNRKKSEDLRRSCGFESLFIEEARKFELYIGTEKYGVKAQDYGKKVILTLSNGETFDSVTNAVRFYPKEEVINEDVIIKENVTIDSNETKVFIEEVLNITLPVLNETNTSILNETTVTEKKGLISKLFGWIKFW